MKCNKLWNIFRRKKGLKEEASLKTEMPFLIKTFTNGATCLRETLTRKRTNAGQTRRFTNETGCSSGNGFPSWVCFLEPLIQLGTRSTWSCSISTLQFHACGNSWSSFHFWRTYVTVSRALLFKARFKHVLKVVGVNAVRLVLQQLILVHFKNVSTTVGIDL